MEKLIISLVLYKLGLPILVARILMQKKPESRWSLCSYSSVGENHHPLNKSNEETSNLHFQSTRSLPTNKFNGTPCSLSSNLFLLETLCKRNRGRETNTIKRDNARPKPYWPYGGGAGGIGMPAATREEQNNSRTKESMS